MYPKYIFSEGASWHVGVGRPTRNLIAIEAAASSRRKKQSPTG